MASSFFGYNSSYGAGAAAQSASAGASLYASRSHVDQPGMGGYIGTGGDHSKFSSSPSVYLSHNGSLRYSADRGYAAIAGNAKGLYSSWLPPPGIDVSAAVDPYHSAVKRSSEVLYNPSTMGAHNTIGQSEAWYSTNYLAKRARIENTSNLPIYPQRPGEKDCAYYMLTRTCKFGDSCKFDHPVWVPDGGIPDWKEVPIAATNDPLPERPGEPDCPFFLKTQRCKYGLRCKFNHPKDLTPALENASVSALPERPTELACPYYMKTGTCKFGVNCKFHHPNDVQIPSLGDENCGVPVASADGNPVALQLANDLSLTPALFCNSKGLPIRMGETDCAFYLKTGSCKYGATCRFNHPEWSSCHPLAASAAANLNVGVINPAAPIYQAIDPRLAPSAVAVASAIYPQRPGQTECDYYMKTGVCKFAERCKYHHPIDRSAPIGQQESVKLTLAGLPRREGAVQCPYYMKTGTCSFGALCRFDHPPPGEVLALAASQEISADEDARAAV